MDGCYVDMAWENRHINVWTKMLAIIFMTIKTHPN